MVYAGGFLDSVCHCLGQFLAVARLCNQPRFAWIRQVTALNQNRRTLLASKNPGKPGSAHAAIVISIHTEQCSMNGASELQILRIERVIRKRKPGIVLETAR